MSLKDFICTPDCTILHHFFKIFSGEAHEPPPTGGDTPPVPSPLGLSGLEKTPPGWVLNPPLSSFNKVISIEQTDDELSKAPRANNKSRKLIWLKCFLHREVEHYTKTLFLQISSPRLLSSKEFDDTFWLIKASCQKFAKKECLCYFIRRLIFFKFDWPYYIKTASQIDMAFNFEKDTGKGFLPSVQLHTC